MTRAVRLTRFLAVWCALVALFGAAVAPRARAAMICDPELLNNITNRQFEILEQAETAGTKVKTKVPKGTDVAETPESILASIGDKGVHAVPDLTNSGRFFVVKDGKIYEFAVAQGDKGLTFTLRDVRTTMPKDFNADVFETVTGGKMPVEAGSRAAKVGSLREAAVQEQLPVSSAGTRNSETLAKTDKKFYYEPKSAGKESALQTKPLSDGKVGFVDEYGNTWVKGPSRTKGESFEWDVQLADNAPAWMKKSPPAAKDLKHMNVSLDGTITH